MTSVIATLGVERCVGHSGTTGQRLGAAAMDLLQGDPQIRKARSGAVAGVPPFDVGRFDHLAEKARPVVIAQDQGRSRRVAQRAHSYVAKAEAGDLCNPLGNAEIVATYRCSRGQASSAGVPQ